MKFYSHITKPFIDLLISFCALVLLSPLILLIIILLSVFHFDTPFFLQERPGKNERLFKVIKFKTMNDKKDINGELLPDNERITFLGKILRNTSLDEIPQLINVLKGEMSLIGPRPLCTEYIPLYNDFQKRRHEVRPGITGLAQVNGRNAITWEEKFTLDIYYIDHLTFSMDLKVLFMTAISVLRRKGIGEVGSKTGSIIFDSFKGNSEEE